MRLSNFNIEVIKVPGDGHCFFHAVTRAFFEPYIQNNFQGLNRTGIVKKFRQELSELLPKKTVSGISYYDSLFNGKLKEFSKIVPEYSLENMQKVLNSNACLPYGFIGYIMWIIKKDIYIYHLESNSLYQTDEYCYLNNQASIILLYSSENIHYDLISYQGKTVFKPNDPIIVFLRSKISCS